MKKTVSLCVPDPDLCKRRSQDACVVQNKTRYVTIALPTTKLLYIWLAYYAATR
jgi:hypothetical protein